jgi:hypothetical protein
MRLIINGVHIIGVETDVLEVIIKSKCQRCLHTSISHKEDGCLIGDCDCKRGYNTYLLLEDEELVSDVIREGLLSN